MPFDQQAINTQFARIVSPCKKIGSLKSVIEHEPKAAPTAWPALALWWTTVGPPRSLSGLSATSARIEYRGRIYLNALSKPEDETEKLLMSVTSQVIGAFTGSFTLQGDVAAVDLLGAWGEPLSAQAGWLPQDDHVFRVSELIIPLVVDDVWTQEA